MMKFGIWSPSHLDVEKLSSFFGKRKFIAATLYPEVAASSHPYRDQLLERILLRFAPSNGTMKRTQSGRFNDFDELLLAFLQDSFPRAKRIRILDTAVSDGRTSVELFERLAACEGLRFQMLATDYAPEVAAISDSRGGLTLVIDPHTDTPLQLIRPPFVFNLQQPESPWLYPINAAVRWLLCATRVRDVMQSYRRGDAHYHSSRFQLLCPQCLGLQASDSRFRFQRHDLFDPTPGEFQVVRAMNVLNRSYFQDAHLRLIVSRIFDGLIVGGLFATGSNLEAGSVLNGAIYARGVHGFSRHVVSGAGSPIDDIVAQHSS